MESFILEMSDDCLSAIWEHLLPTSASVEEAGVGFVKLNREGGYIKLQLSDWVPFAENDFSSQESDYLQLSDQARAKIIKKAHDSHSCLVEFHSHPSPYPAMFSLADLNGLGQFVPHVLWRLKNRPYLAIVVAPSGFDALLWDGNKKAPISLHAIQTKTRMLQPTNLTINSLKES